MSTRLRKGIAADPLMLDSAKGYITRDELDVEWDLGQVEAVMSS